MEEVPNLQNLDLDNNQLDEIEQKSQPKKHTKRTTKWGVKKFEKWWERKIMVHLKTVSPIDLSEILQNFFAGMKTEKGQALTPSALTAITVSIPHHLTCVPLTRNVNFLLAREGIYVLI